MTTAAAPEAIAPAASLTFAEIARERRRVLHLTRAEVAEAAGISPVYLGKVEAGERLPSDDIVQKLATPLRLDWRPLLRFVYIERYPAAAEIFRVDLPCPRCDTFRVVLKDIAIQATEVIR